MKLSLKRLCIIAVAALVLAGAAPSTVFAITGDPSIDSYCGHGSKSSKTWAGVGFSVTFHKCKRTSRNYIGTGERKHTYQYTQYGIGGLVLRDWFEKKVCRCPVHPGG